MSDHVPTLDEVLYYADFWLSLSEKMVRLVDTSANSGEAETVALVAVKMAYDRYRDALQLYTRTTNPPNNIEHLMATMQNEIADLLEK